MQPRYYNPEWGRFLNCDDTSILLATQGKTHGANLFAYCNNNPVNRMDYTGMNSTPHTTGEIIAIKSCLALAVYCQDDEDNAKKLHHWNFYDIVYFYPLESQLLQFIFVFKDSWGYYTINALVGTKDEWKTFIDKRSVRIGDYLGSMANSHNNALLNGLKTGKEGIGVITGFFGASYIIGPTYLYFDDKPYFDNVFRATNAIIAVTRESWDTKYLADRKLKKKKVLSGTDYAYWYID